MRKLNFHFWFYNNALLSCNAFFKPEYDLNIFPFSGQIQMNAEVVKYYLIWTNINNLMIFWIYYAFQFSPTQKQL